MSHEPECIIHTEDGCMGPVALAYQRGVDDTTAYAKQEYRQGLADGYRDGEKAGYLAGYNDHARSRAYAEQVYGPYPVIDERVQQSIGENMGRYIDEHFNQHGKGENP